MGAVYAPYWGTPKHNTVVFAYIYKAILLAKNSGHSGYFAKNDLLHDSEDSRYFARCAGEITHGNPVPCGRPFRRQF